MRHLGPYGERNQPCFQHVPRPVIKKHMFSCFLSKDALEKAATENFGCLFSYLDGSMGKSHEQQQTYDSLSVVHFAYSPYVFLTGSRWHAKAC